MCAVPEGKTIVERFGIFVGELKLPDLAAITGFVDARLLPRTDAEDERCVLVKGLNITKVESAGADNFHAQPGRATVHGAQDRSAGPAGPRYFVRNGADAAQLNFSPTILTLLPP